jgi:hypothetical protein
MRIRNLFTVVAGAVLALFAFSANAQRSGLWTMLDGTTNTVAAKATNIYYPNYVPDPHFGLDMSDGSPGLVGAPFIKVQEYTNVGVTFIEYSSSNCTGVATARLARCNDNLRLFESTPSIVLQAPFNGTNAAICTTNIYLPVETYLALWEIDNTNQDVSFTNGYLAFNLKAAKVKTVESIP